MTLRSAVKTVFSWYGRLDRRGFACAAFGIYLAFFPVDLSGSLAWSALHAGVLAILLGLAMLSISIRRLHDMSPSGWRVIAAFVVIAFLPKIEVPSQFGSVWLWVWLAALSVLRGDVGASVFGAPPRAMPREDAAPDESDAACARASARLRPTSMTEAEILTPEKMRECRASFARQGLMRTIGATLAEIAPGRCTIELPFSDAVSQQHGFFHGGIVGSLADNAGGYAALSLLPLGGDVVTLEYKVNFLRPAAGELLVADGTVLRAGRSVTVTRVDVFIEQGGRRVICAALQQSLMAAPKALGGAG